MPSLLPLPPKHSLYTAQGSRIFWIQRPWTLFLGVAMMAILGATGCEEYYTGLGEKALNPQPPSTSCPDCICECVGGEAPDNNLQEDISGLTYRFSSLEVTSPLSGNDAEMLNEFFSDGITDNTLNVLLQVFHFDSEGDRLDFLASGGEYSEEDESFLVVGDPSEIQCNRDGTSFSSHTPSSLSFDLPDLSEPLPVVHLSLQGRLSSDGTRITNGMLQGALRVEDAQRIVLGGLLNLDDMLQIFQAVPELDLNGDGEPDAYRFEGKYTAQTVAIVAE